MLSHGAFPFHCISTVLLSCFKWINLSASLPISYLQARTLVILSKATAALSLHIRVLFRTQEYNIVPHQPGRLMGLYRKSPFHTFEPLLLWKSFKFQFSQCLFEFMGIKFKIFFFLPLSTSFVLTKPKSKHQKTKMTTENHLSYPKLTFPDSKPGLDHASSFTAGRGE